MTHITTFCKLEVSGWRDPMFLFWHKGASFLYCSTQIGYNSCHRYFQKALWSLLICPSEGNPFRSSQNCTSPPQISFIYFLTSFLPTSKLCIKRSKDPFLAINIVIATYAIFYIIWYKMVQMNAIDIFINHFDLKKTSMNNFL